MTDTDNIRNALADIAAALKDAELSGQPYDARELADIEAIRAALEARLQEAEEGQP